MKIICSQIVLSSNLSLVSRAVPSRPSHPILANIKLEAEGSTMKLTAFDLSLGIETTFDVTVEEPGSIALPAKLLSDIVSRLPDGDITLEVDEGEGMMVTIGSTSGRYQMHGLSAEGFPELPKTEQAQVINLPVSALRDGLRETLFSASPDETKQVLTGVHLTIAPDQLEFAATDGHRLSVVTTENTQESTATELTIPARSLRELERMIAGKDEETIAIHVDHGQIAIEATGQRITSRTLEGQYPAYRQLIPTQFNRRVTVDRRLLLASLERVCVFADPSKNIVKIQLDNGSGVLHISTDSKDLGGGKEALTAQIDGVDLTIAFNVKLLMEGLKALPSTEICMECNTEQTPVILTPLGALKMTYLIMPIQLR